MGIGNSTEAPNAASSAAPEETNGGTGIKLYKYKQTKTGGQWDLLSSSADVRFYDINQDNGKKAEWHLEIGTDVDILVSDLYEVEEIEKRVTLVAKGEDAYALKFPSLASLQKLGNEYKSKLFENIYKLPYNNQNKDKVLDRDAVLTMEGETAESQQQWSSDLVDEAPANIRRDKAQGRAGKQVHAVRLGANDRSYLVRDKQIEVLKNATGGVKSTGLTFDIKSSNGRQSFTPNKLLLANSESRLNMLSPEGGRNFFHTDIETGKVVSEWQFQKDGVDFSMKDLANETRGSQLENSNIFFGIGEKTLARWDMRTPEGVVQDMTSPSVVRWDAGNIYTKSPQFNCMATSGAGYIAIGSQDGCIRLYGLNSLNKAVTTIKGLGGPITAIDVTYDGKWVLATTKNYLMVVKAEFKGSNGKETTGFKTAMGSKAPAPRLLKLKIEDQRLLKGEPLRQGKFTWVTEAGRAERWILASCGNHSVLWNFRQVKLAKPSTTSYGGLTACMNYHLVEKQDQVVDSVFMHDNHTISNECSTVVATKYQIFSLAD